ncbi:MAG: SDR family oxidoreductase [Salinisphaeraceae bacterium]|nr:SDR family oxidoreductase [Salinisphaeraceae bacterium]
MGICEGRTIIITGAGGGLGKAYAEALVAEGANVVVNDIRMDAAEAVAASLGEKALANNGDITTMEGAQSIVDAALAKFGEVHGVINNAGVLRDRMFLKLTEDDWDMVMRVHLRGHFCLANILANRWRDQAKEGNEIGGRIINTSSGAGLNGSIGQSNYSAAKGGIATLTIVQAAELRRYGITANALAPAARTGMTEEVFADMMKKPDGDAFDFFAPENVAPIVVWLCSELSADVTGRVFEAAGGKLSVADGWRTGEITDKGDRWEPAELTDVVKKLIAESPEQQKCYGT